MTTTIGPYDLLDRVGEGGMGEVWRARHRTLGRLVAVKLIRSGTLGASVEDDRVTLRRFEREAQTAAALRSPHSIQIQDFGVTPDGNFFQVMELLDGLDLQAFVERFGAVPAGRVVGLLRQAADALAEAHAQGFVHRDIKPSNLFLCRLGTRVDFLKVLDFGLARPADAADVHVTRTGAIPGSPATLAPEILRGEAPTDKADVYALGCVATWLLMGRLPFEARTPIEMVVAHLEKPPLVLDGVPAPLAELIANCLAKDPARRPTIRELSRQLAATGLERSWSEDDAEAWWDVNRPERAPVTTHADAPEPDREQVYQRLREHFESSRIDLNDYERRLAVARRAESPVAVLDALRGLPTELPKPTAMVRAEEALPALGVPRRKLVSVFTSLRRGGVWHPDPNTRLVSVFGNSELDLRLAEMSPGMTELRCVAVFGNVEITVPPGMYVELNGMGVLGNFEGDTGAPHQPTDGRPWLRVSGVAVLGNVEVHVLPIPKPGRSIGEIAVATLEQVAEKVLGKRRD